MEKCVRTLLQSAFILLTFGIIVQSNAQPVVVAEIPNNSTNFITAGNYTYFTSSNSLWRTDGTAAGTIELKNGLPTVPFAIREFKNHALFLTGKDDVTDSDPATTQLWRTDGTPGGTIQLMSRDFISLLDKTPTYFFFEAADASTGRELYRTDGTPTGTMMIRDINPGPELSLRGGAAVLGDHLIFNANDGVHGIEPWKSDGTSASTMIIEDINPGLQSSIVLHIDPFVYNGLYYFGAITDEFGGEPWVSDGTAEGTRLLKDINPGAGNSHDLQYAIGHGGILYFFELDDYDAGADQPYGRPALLYRSAAQTGCWDG